MGAPPDVGFRPCCHRYPSAFASQGLGDGEADAPGRRGDEGDPALDAEVHFPHPSGVLPPAAINEGDPVEPRPSATVLLIRGDDPWELLMVQRPGGADFAPGAWVFPGGTVHGDDAMWEDEIRAAAVRELFEEAGILLVGGAHEAECAKVRGLIEAGSSSRGATQQPTPQPDLAPRVSL